MSWETHEIGILDKIKRKVNPVIDPPNTNECPVYHPGHGWNYFHSHRKMAYNDFGRVNSALLSEMFEEAKAQVPTDREIVDAPYPDNEFRGDTEVDFSSVSVVVEGFKVMMGVRYRPDKWYDFCITVFTNFKNTDRPDISSTDEPVFVYSPVYQSPTTWTTSKKI